MLYRGSGSSVVRSRRWPWCWGWDLTGQVHGILTTCILGTGPAIASGHFADGKIHVASNYPNVVSEDDNATLYFEFDLASMQWSTSTAAPRGSYTT